MLILFLILILFSFIKCFTISLNDQLKFLKNGFLFLPEIAKNSFKNQTFIDQIENARLKSSLNWFKSSFLFCDLVEN